MKKIKKYWKLFFSCLYISAFTFGGGFVIIPLMRKKFVEELKWLEEEEMMDLTAIAQATPGAIAVNEAILVGYKVAGLIGAALAVFATILPPLIILSVISFFYAAFRDNVVVNAVLKGMQAGVAAVLCDVVLSMGTEVAKKKNILQIGVMVAAFILVFFVDLNVVYVILGCIALAVVFCLGQRFFLKKKKKQPAAEAEETVIPQPEKRAEERAFQTEKAEGTNASPAAEGRETTVSQPEETVRAAKEAPSQEESGCAGSAAEKASDGREETFSREENRKEEETGQAAKQKDGESEQRGGE